MKQKIAHILLMLILCIIVYGCKSNYEKGVELINEKKYNIALEKFAKIDKEDKDYKSSLLKISFVQGLIALEMKNWKMSLLFLSNELLHEDEEIAANYLKIAKDEYLKSIYLNGLDIKVEPISISYSGFFTKGCEVKASITNNMDKDLLINYSLKFQLLIKKEQGYKISTNNTIKTAVFSPVFEGKNIESTREIQVNNKSTVQFMINFDDIDESSSSYPDNIYFFDGAGLEYENDRLMILLKDNAWLLVPLSAFKIEQTSSRNENSKSEYYDFDLSEYTEINKIESKENFYIINGKEKLKKDDVKLSTYGSTIDSKTYCDTMKTFKLIVPYKDWIDKSSFILQKNKKDKLEKSSVYDEKIDYYGYELSLEKPEINDPNVLINLNNSPSEYKVCCLYKIKEVNVELSDFSDFMSKVESLVVEIFILDKENKIIYRRK